MPSPAIVRIQIIATPEFREELDAWRAANGNLNQSDAIRLLVRHGMKAKRLNTKDHKPKRRAPKSQKERVAKGKAVLAQALVDTAPLALPPQRKRRWT